ncbi:MAG: hypothetical protein Q8N05_19725 [Bacteroidota bacterium]|nr:hypothetical protein [Bacteroidota bacterium]
MTKDKLHSDHQDLLNGLQSDDSLKVIETLEELRISGKVTDIPVLIELLHLTQNPEIKMKIIGLFANLKESDAIPLITKAIQDQKYAPELKELLASCWENGLDYSNYLPLFVGLLIDTDFLVAFEAYTVITNMTSQIEQSKVDLEIDRLENALVTIPEQKRQLILDVIDFLPSLGF